jgi:hypothetical protein
MTKVDVENEEVSCVALGGLEGEKFDEALTALRSDLKNLKTFVADSCDAVDVGPGPMVSLGHEVQRDVLIINHLDKKLTEAVSQLIDMLTMTRMARAALREAICH